ncbi:MAG TPA: sigma 54-interacting transcriptional regulator [Pirellulales bacterium]|nr:sigma 54-interacting transcriptional regulator [Pirellulales bacterium]
MNAASLQAIATSVARERALHIVLHRVVAELADQEGVALARIWLVDAGDRCPTCVARKVCPTQTRCLHLAASAGASLDGECDWSGLEGAFQRVPLGVGKVGRIGASGESVLLEDTAADRQWILDKQWIQDEAIVSFAGHPLEFRGEIVGALALFSRERLTRSDFDLLRAFADQAAVAIANARAFEEIELLRSRLESENRYLREEVNEAQAFGEIIGQSPALGKLLEQIELVAPTAASVLVLGESGTGKELVAREIHRRSTRADHSLIRVNCAAIPRELFESEFFGHVKGSFTGAVKDRIGRFQLADGGTLFLDEVGEIPLDLQGKLLRVLQEGQIERVGDDETRKVDVRVIAATNRDLEVDVAGGRFRQDLYFRLSVFPIEVLPLRDRPEDIPLLAQHFFERLCLQMNRPVTRLTTRSLGQLGRYAWPGNVRELQNVIERAVISSRGGEPRFDNLLAPAGRKGGQPVALERHHRPAGAVGVLTGVEFRRLEAENLMAALEEANWKIYGPRGAAERLGMRPTTLASRLKKLGIKKPR